MYSEFVAASNFFILLDKSFDQSEIEFVIVFPLAILQKS